MHERDRIKMEVAIIRALLDEAERERPIDPRVNAQLVEELRRLIDVLGPVAPHQSGTRLRVHA